MYYEQNLDLELDGESYIRGSDEDDNSDINNNSKKHNTTVLDMTPSRYRRKSDVFVPNDSVIDINKPDIDIVDKQNDNANNDLISDRGTKVATKKIGSPNFRTKIITDHIRPRINKEIDDCYSGRDKWNKVASLAFGMSELFGIVQTVLSFTAASYDIILISYLAGLLGVLCIAFNRYGSYAIKTSSEKTSQLNEILASVGIKDKVPDIADNIDDPSKKK